jgi:Transglutaminase-like superfamily
MRSNSILPLWRRFLGLPCSRRLLLLEAAFWLAAARLAILLVPFPRIARYLGKLRPPAQDAGESQEEQALAKGVAWAIERSARRLPFRLVCLPRALAGWQMLHRRQIAGHLHFGASRDAACAALRTHAWLDACGVEVTGYPEAHRCVEIGYLAR